MGNDSKMDEEIMEMKEKIKRLDNYCECTDVSLGNLYLFKCSDERRIPFYYPSLAITETKKKFLYDSSTGNVHMFPSDIELAELCADFIQQKGPSIGLRKSIYDQIVNLKESENTKEKYKNITSEEFKWQNTQVFNGTDYKRYESLFFYLRVTYNKTSYDLVFNRFFIDSSKRVNCILLCFQIEIFDSDSPLKGSKKREESPCTKNYPHTSENGAWSEDKEGNKVYYNFEVDIHSQPNEIAEKFLDFVLEEDKKRNRKNN